VGNQNVTTVGYRADAFISMVGAGSHGGVFTAGT